MTTPQTSPVKPVEPAGPPTVEIVVSVPTVVKAGWGSSSRCCSRIVIVLYELTEGRRARMAALSEAPGPAVSA